MKSKLHCNSNSVSLDSWFCNEGVATIEINYKYCTSKLNQLTDTSIICSTWTNYLKTMEQLTDTNLLWHWCQNLGNCINICVWRSNIHLYTTKVKGAFRIHCPEIKTLKDAGFLVSVSHHMCLTLTVYVSSLKLHQRYLPQVTLTVSTFRYRKL